MKNKIENLENYLNDFYEDFLEVIEIVGEEKRFSCKEKTIILIEGIVIILDYMASNLDASNFFEAKNTLTKTLNERNWHEQ